MRAPVRLPVVAVSRPPSPWTRHWVAAFPPTRIVQAPKGFQIYMKGLTDAGADSLGPGLALRSRSSFVYLSDSEDHVGR